MKKKRRRGPRELLSKTTPCVSTRVASGDGFLVFAQYSRTNGSG